MSQSTELNLVRNGYHSFEVTIGNRTVGNLMNCTPNGKAVVLNGMEVIRFLTTHKRYLDGFTMTMMKTIWLKAYEECAVIAYDAEAEKGNTECQLDCNNRTIDFFDGIFDQTFMNTWHAVLAQQVTLYIKLIA